MMKLYLRDTLADVLKDAVPGVLVCKGVATFVAAHGPDLKCGTKLD